MAGGQEKITEIVIITWTETITLCLEWEDEKYICSED